MLEHIQTSLFFVVYEEKAIRDKIREYPKIVCVITGE